MGGEAEVPKGEANLDEDGLQLWFTCPWCGKKHWHAVSNDPERPAYGHRESHCLAKDAPKNGYVLVPAPLDRLPAPRYRIDLLDD